MENECGCSHLGADLHVDAIIPIDFLRATGGKVRLGYNGNIELDLDNDELIEADFCDEHNFYFQAHRTKRGIIFYIYWRGLYNEREVYGIKLLHTVVYVDSD